MAKELTYRGKTLEELQNMGEADLKNILLARSRRILKRGLSDQQKKLLVKVKESKNKIKPIKTHCRDMIILPEMVGQLFNVYSGQNFEPINPTVEMVGRYLGEFIQTRKEVKHKAPGVGATKSTKHASMK
jgi:small subunit ribosomal protein S19